MNHGHLRYALYALAATTPPRQSLGKGCTADFGVVTISYARNHFAPGLLARVTELARDARFVSELSIHPYILSHRQPINVFRTNVG